MRQPSLAVLEQSVRARARPCTDRDEQLLVRMMALTGFITHDSDRSFRLHSRIDSHVYVHGRQETTEHPGFLALIGRKIANAIWAECGCGRDNRQPCAIGVPDAATPLAVAASVVSFLERRGRRGSWIASRVMHKQQKHHGAHRRWVDGEPNHERHTYFLLDNTITSGRSVLNEGWHLVEDGYTLKDVTCLILVDRERGGIETTQRGIWIGERLEQFKNVVAIYKLTELVSAFGRMRLWPPEKVLAVHNEIRPATQTHGR